MNYELERQFGALRIGEVYDFYDVPLFYSATTQTGQELVFFWIERTEAGNCYLCVELSHPRFTALRTGAIGIREAILNPENGNLFKYWDQSNGLDNGLDFELISPADVPKGYLPPEDDRLDLPSELIPARQQTALEVSKSVGRQIIDVALSINRKDTLFPTEALGRFLTSFQRLMDALSTDQSKAIIRIPTSVKDESELLVRELYAGSFGIRFEKQMAEFLEEEIGSSAGEKFQTLLDGFNNSKKAVEELKRLNLPSRVRAIHLVKELSAYNIDIQSDWGSPRGRKSSSKLSVARLQNSLAFVESQVDLNVERHSHTGLLEAIDVHKKSFGFFADSGERFSGKLAREFYTRKWRLPERLKVTMEDSIKVNSVTGKETTQRKLISVKVP